MAESAVESIPPNARFFCHTCTSEIHPKPDYTCPQCEKGFIEEITDDFSQANESPSSQVQANESAQLEELWGQRFLNSFQSMNNLGSSNQDSQGGEDRNVFRRQPFRISVNSWPAQQPQQYQGILQLIMERLVSDLGQPLNFLPIHGNPGDYAWGVGGLDNIITQLLNQLEGAGPAPADPADIDNLPLVKVTQEQVDAGKQCSVCMEDLQVNEEVKRLPCEHHFHVDCIVPWLKMHGTCPVCRKDLHGVDSSLKDDYVPNPTELVQQQSDISQSSQARNQPSSSNNPSNNDSEGE